VCGVGLCVFVRVEGQLWLIFATERKEKGNGGRRATVRVQIPKSKDTEMWQNPNSFRNTLVSLHVLNRRIRSKLWPEDYSKGTRILVYRV
jgi:hypothetical protein